MTHLYTKRKAQMYYNGPIIYDEVMVASCINDSKLRPFRANRSELKIKSIYRLSANEELLRGDNGDKLSKSEELALNILINTGHIKRTSCIRHGLTKDEECDIIVDNRAQYEVISEMSDSTGNKKLKQLEDKVLFTNTLNGIIYASKAIKSKLDAKQYRDDYEKHLFVIYAGTRESAIAMANSVKNHIIRRGTASKNFFTQIYMLRYDLASNQYFFSTTKNWKEKEYVTFRGKEPLIYRTRVIDFKPDNTYYLLDIVDGDRRSMPPMVMRGWEIENFIQKYDISFS